jgi:hypothetical protein
LSRRKLLKRGKTAQVTALFYSARPVCQLPKRMGV